MAKIKLIDGPVANLSIKIYDATQNNRLINTIIYTPGQTKEIVYTGVAYYLDFDSPATRLLIEIFSGNVLLLEKYADSILDTTPSSNLFIDWKKDLVDGYVTSHKFNTYYIYKHLLANSIGNLKAYTEVNNTTNYVDFAVYSGNTIYDQDNNPFFTSDNMTHNVGGPLEKPYFSGGGDAKLTSVPVLLSSTQGFCMGWMFNQSCRFVSDSIIIDVQTESGYVTVTLNDGVTTLTQSFRPTGLTPWASLIFSVYPEYIIIMINGNYQDAITMRFDDLNYLPLAITEFEIGMTGVAEFFLEKGPAAIERMKTILDENRPELIGVTNATQFMIGAGDFEGNYRDYYLDVKGKKLDASIDSDSFIRTFRPEDIRVLPGDYCFVWDNFNSSEVNYTGVTFKVRPKDFEDSLKASGFEVDTDMFYYMNVPVNGYGYFGIYVPWDVIYLVTIGNAAHNMRFAVPRKKEARLRDVAEFYRENRYYT